MRLLNAPTMDWERDAAAPLRVEREFVQRVYTRLHAWAEALGLPLRGDESVMTDDPDLHLVDDRGREIRAMRVNGTSHVFMLLPGVRNVRIMSRASRPSDVEGAYVDDRRYLGVLVGKIQIWAANKTSDVSHHLSEPHLEGWTPLENGQPMRWTAGAGVVDLGPESGEAISILSIEILAGGPYKVEAIPAEVAYSA